MDIEVVIEGAPDISGVRAPGHHFVSFTTEIDQLPALVGDQLKACL